MSYSFRGRRVAYDNVANGSATGFENHHPGTSVTSTVSHMGHPLEQVGSVNNIANGSIIGVESHSAPCGSKFTSSFEDVAD